MKEGLAYYSPIQYLKAVEMLKAGKKNVEVCHELFISDKAVMKIKKLIKGSLPADSARQLK